MSAIMVLGKFNDDTVSNSDELFEYPLYNSGKGNIERNHCNTKNRSTIQNLNKFPWKSFTDEHGQVVKYVTFDMICWGQGWFFNKKFFNRKDTIIYCTTKRGMIDALNKYLDFKNKDDGVYAREVYNEFISKWEDGMFFEMSW